MMDRGPIDEGAVFDLLNQASRLGAILVANAMLMVALMAQVPERVLLQWDSHAYFMRSDPGRLEVYALETETWLATVPLKDNPTAIAADADGYYIAYGAMLYRYDTSFQNETFLRTVANEVHGLFTDGEVLIADHSANGYGHYLTLNKFTGAQIDSASYYIENTHGSTISRNANRIYGIRQGYSPMDVCMLSYSDTGMLEGITDSPYHGDYEVGERFWIFPDEVRVVDSSGTLYSAADLTFLGSLGSPFASISFNGNLPIILRNNRLHAYNAALMPVGEYLLDVDAHEIVVHGGKVTVFTHPILAEAPIQSQTVPLEAINAPDPNGPIDPTGLAFVPNYIFLLEDNIHLIDFETGMFFSWSVSRKAYSPAIPLRANPTAAVYSPSHNRVYCAYADTVITSMDMNAIRPEEVPFAIAPAEVRGLAAPGPWLLVQDNAGAWATHRVYNKAGIQTDAADWNYYSSTYTWSESEERLYFFRDDTTPNDLHFETFAPDGTISERGESTYHGELDCVPPIFVVDGKAELLLGSGQILETPGLILSKNLPNRIQSATMLKGSLYTLYHEVSEPYWEPQRMAFTRLQRWSEQYSLEGSTSVPGDPVSLLTHQNQLVVISLVEDVPIFFLFNSGLDLLSSSLGEDAELKSLDVEPHTATLSWNTTGLEGRTATLQRFHFDSADWESIATVDAGLGTHTLTGLPSGSDFLYRILINAHTAWEPTQEVVSQFSMGYFRSQVELPALLDFLEFQKLESDLTWTSVAIQDYTTFEALLDSSLGPFDPVQYRLLLDVPVFAEVTPLVLYQLKMEWELIPETSYPTLVYRKTGNPAVPYELYATLDPGQNSLIIEGSAPDIFPELTFYADRPDPASDRALQTSYILATDASWAEHADAMAYLVRFAEQAPQIIPPEQTHIEQVHSLFPAPGEDPFIQFSAISVRAVTDVLQEEQPGHTFVRTLLQFEGTYDAQYALQYRVSSEDEWITAYETSGNTWMEHALDTTTVPQYRILEQILIPEAALGYCIFNTRVPDSLDSFNNSFPIDTLGNRYVQWLGYYNFSPANPAWLYAYDFGWTYPIVAGSVQWWIWTKDFGWTYWSENTPNLFHSSLRSAWFFHWQGSPWYYNYASGDFEKIGPQSY